MAIHLRHTILSGQTFAFSPEGEGFLGVVGGKPCFVREEEGDIRLQCEPGEEGFWRNYFDMDADYDALLAPYAGEEAVAACIRACEGLHLLRQPVWEALCALILSANNHQKRIESIYRAISRAFGEEISFRGGSLFAFPRPERLAMATEEDLRECGAGYRARYLVETARMAKAGFSFDLDGMEYEEALAHLTQLPGVGEKVADCVLLFSTRHGVAFPVDVWIERVLRGTFGMEGTKKEIKKRAQERFGERAGLIQQYLFHGARTGVLLLEGGRA